MWIALAVAGLVLGVAFADAVGVPLRSAGAAGEPRPLSSTCPEASPVATDVVHPLGPTQAKDAAPPVALAPSARGFDHRTLTALRPSLERVKHRGLVITGSRTAGTLATGPAGGFALDGVVCMIPLQTTPAETAATIINGDAALYANSAPDTDTIVRPTASGVTVMESRRGVEAPTSFRWKLGLPAGMRLRALASGAVAIEDPADPAPAARAMPRVVSAAPAPDPDGEGARAKLTVSDPDELTLASPPDADAVAVTVGAKRRSHRKRKPPPRVKSYPLVGVTGNLSTEAANAACSFARSQPRGKRLMLLNFGQAHVEGQTGRLGAGRQPFHSNDEVLSALNAAARSYRRSGCHRPGRRATIAYGVGNYKFSATGNGGHPISRRLAKRLGKAQLRVARRIKHRAKDAAAVAGDLEPRWDPGRPGVAVGKALARGASTGRLTYYNFGTAGHCPPFPGRCRGWRPKVLGDISQKHGAVALPQIYYSFQARQWARVRRAWDRRHSTRRHCRRHRSGRCFSFAGALSQPRPCGAKLTPARSWRHLWKANRNGSVGRELILYNPGRRTC